MLAVMIGVVCQSALNVAILIRFGLTLLGPEAAATSQPPHDPEAEEERIAYEDYHAIQTGVGRSGHRQRRAAAVWGRQTLQEWAARLPASGQPEEARQF